MSMPQWLVNSLLIAFGIHFVAFSSLFFIRKDKYYAYISLTFLLLVLSYSTRIWLGNFHLAGVKLFWMFRVAAWAAALISISMTIRRYARARN
jgi:hypothetical protein